MPRGVSEKPARVANLLLVDLRFVNRSHIVKKSKLTDVSFSLKFADTGRRDLNLRPSDISADDHRSSTTFWTDSFEISSKNFLQFFSD